MAKEVTLEEALATEYASRPELWAALKACKRWIKNNRGLQKPVKVSQEEPRSSVSVGSVEQIINTLTNLDEHFGEASSVLRDQQTKKAADLASIREEKKEIVERLKKLFKISVYGKDASPLPDILHDLFEQYETNEREFEEEMQQLRKEMEEELHARNTAWNRETQERVRAVRQRNEDQNKRRVREQKEYKEQLTLKNNREDDEFEQLRAEHEKALSDISAEAREHWNTEEQSLKEQEQEFKSLKEKVRGFDLELKSAERRGQTIGASIAQKNNEKQKRKLESEVQAKARIRAQEIRRLETRANNLKSAVDEARDNLKATQRRYQELSTVIVQSASNADALEMLQKLAMEQAKGKKR